MELRQLRAGGPLISKIGLGTSEDGEPWGRISDDREIVRAIEVALDAGVTWIDTAETYSANRSEELVAKAIKSRRDSVVVATKLAPHPWGTGFRPDEVRRGCEGSLERLGLDYLDLYQLHLPDANGIPLQDTWGAMADLVNEGLVRHIGVSNFSCDLIEQCEPIHPVTSVQMHYSMVYSENWALAAWCAERGIPVLAYGPLGYGLLTGAITAESEFDPRDWRSGVGEDDLYLAVFAPGLFELNLELVQQLRELAARHGHSVVELVLGWTTAQSPITSAIVGTRDEKHARANAHAGAVQLSPAVVADVAELVEARRQRIENGS